MKSARNDETQLGTTPTTRVHLLELLSAAFAALKVRSDDLREVSRQAFGIEVNILIWLYPHAEWLFTRFHVQNDGLTPYQRLKGKP